MTAERKPRPVGIFDSGIGGLTVVRALLAAVPDLDIVYFGDTARVPYGTKSDRTVSRLTLECIRFLTHYDVGLVVVACNTASSIALAEVSRVVDVPVVGMIEPGVREALRASKTGVIGVIGTEATIRSGGYEKRLRELKPDVTIATAACPLFVPLVEEGWTHHDVTRQVAREYLAPLLAAGIDTLILGCTHYPMLTDVLGEVAGPAVTLIDTGAAAAADVARSGPASGTGDRRFFVSDVPNRFAVNGARFLGQPLGTIRLVEQSDLPWFERTLSEDS